MNPAKLVNLDDIAAIKNEFSKLGLHLISWVTSNLAKMLGILFVMLVGWYITKKIRELIYALLIKLKMHEAPAWTLAGIVQALLLCALAYGCFYVFGLRVASLAAVVGAFSVFFGFALQGSFSNVATGILLFFFRPFKEGHFVKIGEHEGHVEEVDLFTVTLRTLDHSKISIPNKQVYGSIIQNFSDAQKRRVGIQVGVPYDCDVAQVKAFLKEALVKVPHVSKDPAPEVTVEKFSDASILLNVRIWCDPQVYLGMKDVLFHAVLESLRKNKIEIPYPRTEVKVINHD